MFAWHCMDCRVNRELDVHGRCGVCESEAVIDLSGSEFNPETPSNSLEAA